jgi:hypothetical protein
METSKSPRTALRVAYRLAQGVLPDHTHRFSRKDFTLPQLFACLVVREILRLSYRKAEAFLADSPDWLAEIGVNGPPDHNTLWRAFGALCTLRGLNRMLDLQAELFAEARPVLPPNKPLAIDSTHYEQRHRSRHYERRCRRMGLAAGGKFARKISRSPQPARAQALNRLPKLALAGAACCHLVLAARTRLGAGSDAPDWSPLLRDACRRARVRTAVADAGFDSEANHRLAREDLRVRSIIPAKIGRPSKHGQPPTSYWRRRMHRRFERGTDQKLYGERAQAETIHSMLKRNLGDCLRSRLPQRRKREMLFRTVVHNLTLVAALQTG